ncbi:MAG: hypothetical protein P8H88_00670, partial [Flavobacteriales bacterium]|nr:hypothetical protein [Flavobacteriales bacterium]
MSVPKVAASNDGSCFALGSWHTAHSATWASSVSYSSKMEPLSRSEFNRMRSDSTDRSSNSGFQRWVFA